MTVGLRGESRIGVAENPLHRGDVGAAHEEERRRRVAQVVEPDRPDLPRRPELHLAARTAAELVILRGLDVAAALAPTLVQPAFHDSRAVKRSTQDELELHALGRHRSVGCGEDEVGRSPGDRVLEIGQQLGGDRDDVSVAALGGVPAVGVGDGEEPVREIDVGLPQSQQLALSEPGEEEPSRRASATDPDSAARTQGHLLGAEKVRHRLRDPALLHVCRHGVRTAMSARSCDRR